MTSAERLKAAQIRNSLRVMITEYTDNVGVAVYDQDEGPVDDVRDGAVDPNELGEKLEDLGVEAREIESCCDGTVLCGDADPGDVESALTSMGYVSIEHETVDEPVRHDDDDEEDESEDAIEREEDSL